MNTNTETLHGTAARSFLVYDSHGAAFETEIGEPVEVRETRSGGKYVIHSRRLFAKTMRMSHEAMTARVDPA